MKQNDLVKIIAVAFLSAVISLVVATAIFNSPAKHNLKVPVVQTITTTFPDVANDQNYQSIFNQKALDPTLPVQIGNSQNNTPFNSTQ